MSSLLFKNDIHNILPTTTENSVNVLNNIKINNLNDDNEYSATSSAFMNNNNLNTVTSTTNMSKMVGGNYNTVTSTTNMSKMVGGNYNTVTSTTNMSQLGGGNNYINSDTSDLNNDINNLLSMLTSESNIQTKNVPINTLENKLRNMLNQDGGNNKQNDNNFSDELNTEVLEQQIYNIVKNNKQKAGNNKHNTNNKQKGGNYASDIVKIGLAATGAIVAYNLLKPTDNSVTESEVNVNKLLNHPTQYVQQPIAQQQFAQQFAQKQQAHQNKLQDFAQQFAQQQFAQQQQQFAQQQQEKQQNKYSNVLSTTSQMDSPIQSPTFSTTSSMIPSKNYDNVFLPSQQQNNIINPYNNSTTTSVILGVDDRLEALNKQSQPSFIGGNNDLIGGNNPALVAFRKIVTNVVNKLGIKYNKALKVAAKVQADVKAKQPKISHNKLADAANTQLTNNLKEYKDFFKTL